jgi:hypothetical protein
MPTPPSKPDGDTVSIKLPASWKKGGAATALLAMLSGGGAGVWGVVDRVSHLEATIEAQNTRIESLTEEAERVRKLEIQIATLAAKQGEANETMGDIRDLLRGSDSK